MSYFGSQIEFDKAWNNFEMEKSQDLLLWAFTQL